jgi:lysyl-tRNA synthetase class 2
MAWQPAADVNTLQARAQLFRTVRAFFDARDVLEVHTPTIGVATVTDPDVEAIEVPGYGYLQTSPEYFMKRLLASGVPDCYSLGPVYRKDERGRLHNHEFTLLEWYRLAWNDGRLQQEVAELVNAVLGPADYVTRTYKSLVGELDRSRTELDLAFAQAVAELPGRVFVTHYPADQAVLARLHPDDAHSAARFELIIDGIEIANGYWELIDAIEHRRRFAEDNRIRAERGLAHVVPDAEFLAALEYGLPECAGVALGMDRLLMLALHRGDLKDVLAFSG